jgi:imidazolonepropionase-like amidohydrolase
MNAKIIGAKGEIGQIVEGAYADILVVDGNPLENLKLMEDDGAHIPIVMKGGSFHRNRLAA